MLGAEAERTYANAIASGRTANEAYELAGLAAGRSSGIDTFGYEDQAFSLGRPTELRETFAYRDAPAGTPIPLGEQTQTAGSSLSPLDLLGISSAQAASRTRNAAPPGPGPAYFHMDGADDLWQWMQNVGQGIERTFFGGQENPPIPSVSHQTVIDEAQSAALDFNEMGSRVRSTPHQLVTEEGNWIPSIQKYVNELNVAISEGNQVGIDSARREIQLAATTAIQSDALEANRGPVIYVELNRHEKPGGCFV